MAWHLCFKQARRSILGISGTLQVIVGGQSGQVKTMVLWCYRRSGSMSTRWGRGCSRASEGMRVFLEAHCQKENGRSSGAQEVNTGVEKS